MKIKDCLFGQVRKLGGKYENQLCTDLPRDLASLITKQEIATWDNATGMNPLHNYFDAGPITVAKLSYGEMLAETYDMGFVCITSLTRNKLTSAEYEKLIRRDYRNEYSASCKRLAQWWTCNYLLNRPDILEYDYVVLRQIDTIFENHVDQECLLGEMTQRNIEVFKADAHLADIPIMYDMSHGMGKWHASSMMTWPYAFILNRAAVSTIKDTFYQHAVFEVNKYFERIGSENFTLGFPGGIMLSIAIKKDIDVIALNRPIQAPTQSRGTTSKEMVNYPENDYARLDRTGI